MDGRKRIALKPVQKFVVLNKFNSFNSFQIGISVIQGISCLRLTRTVIQQTHQLYMQVCHIRDILRIAYQTQYVALICLVNALVSTTLTNFLLRLTSYRHFKSLLGKARPITKTPKYEHTNQLSKNHWTCLHYFFITLLTFGELHYRT